MKHKSKRKQSDIFFLCYRVETRASRLLARPKNVNAKFNPN